MKNLKKLIQPMILIVVLVLFANYIIANWSSFASIRVVNPWGIVWAALFILASLHSTGMVNDLTIEPHGIKPKRHEVFGLAAVTRFLNQIAPNYTGASVRAMFFKKKYGVSYAKFSSSFAVANIMQLFTASAIGVVTYLLSVNGRNTVQDITMMIGVVVVTFIALNLPTTQVSRLLKNVYKRFNYKIFERLSVLPEEYAKVRSYPKLFVRMLFWMTILIIVSGMTTFSLFAALGQELTIGGSLFIASLSYLSVLLSITPAGLGIREGILVFGASILGVPIPVSIAVSVLMRIVEIVVAGTVSLFSLRIFK